MKIKRIKLPLVATVTASVLAASLTVRASGQDVYFADGEQPTAFTSANSEVVEPTSLDVYPAAVAVLLARAAWAGFKSGVAAGAGSGGTESADLEAPQPTRPRTMRVDTKRTLVTRVPP